MDGFELTPGEQKTSPISGMRPVYQRTLHSNNVWGGHWVSDDGKEWLLWCPCVELGKSVCEDWTPAKEVRS